MNSVLVLLLALVSLCHGGADTMDFYNVPVTYQSYSPSSREAGLFFVRQSQIILFGGYREQINIRGGANQFFNDMFAYDIDDDSWYRIHAGGSAAPSPRAFFCATYYEPHDAIYLYAGVNYNTTFFMNYSEDPSWKYTFANNTWQQIYPANTPSARASMGCGLVGESIYMTHGAVPTPVGEQGFKTTDEMWSWNLETNSWTFINRSSFIGGPTNRTQIRVAHVPETNNLIVLSGESFDQFSRAIPQGDMYLYNTVTGQWSTLNTTGAPAVIREFFAMQMLSSRYLFLQGGDAQGNLTQAQTCLSPMLCLIQATPTSDTFMYDLKHQTYEKLTLDHQPLALKRAMMTMHEGIVYMFGGYGWSVYTGAMRSDSMSYMVVHPKYLFA
jgi:N-acetylneuraminic acid mutarotase